MSKDGKKTSDRPVSPINGQPLPNGKKFTSENAREMQKRSTEKKRHEKSVRQAFMNLLADSYSDKNGNQQSGAEVLAAAIFKDAISQHNHKFYELCLRLAGEAIEAEQKQSDNGKLDEILQDLLHQNNNGGGKS